MICPKAFILICIFIFPKIEGADEENQQFRSKRHPKSRQNRLAADEEECIFGYKERIEHHCRYPSMEKPCFHQSTTTIGQNNNSSIHPSIHSFILKIQHRRRREQRRRRPCRRRPRNAAKVASSAPPTTLRASAAAQWIAYKNAMGQHSSNDSGTAASNISTFCFDHRRMMGKRSKIILRIWWKTLRKNWQSLN